MKRFISYMAMALALTACGSDDELTDESQSGNRHPLMFTATVEDVQTRVTGNSWDDGDVIGVKISTDESTTGKYKLNADGTVKEVITGVEWQGTESATVTAWYPYAEEQYAHTISDQSKGYSNFDILRAQTEGSSAAPVNLVFKHQMAKVRCKLMTADGTSTGISGATVKFWGYTTMIVNNGNVSGEGQTGYITSYEDSESGVTTYTALLTPQSVNKETEFIKITIGNKTFSYKPASEISLEAGKSYNYNIKVNVEDYTTDADGTYHVYTAEGLEAWASAAKTTPSTSCTLESNITLTGENNWTPIAQDYSNPYTGTFDGNGKSISGLNISSASSTPVGFIGGLGTGSTVKNLTLNGATMSSTSSYANIGAVAGYNNGTISNCHVIKTTISGKNQAGGVVGYNNGTISYCHVADDCTVKVESDVYLGGIAGFNASSGVITACYALCSLGVTGSARVGGICGGSPGSCISCYSCCKLLDATSKAGGVSGNESSSVTACYWANVPKATNTFTKGIGIGDGTDTTIEVGGSDGKTWADAVTGMNSALTDAGHTDYKYEIPAGGTLPELVKSNP